MTEQRFIDADEAMDIVYSDHVAIQFVSKHRWFTKQLVVFERDEELLGLYYFEPATEEQEDADRFEDERVLIFPVRAREVTKTVYKPA